MEAGLTDHVWTFNEIIGLLDWKEAENTEAGPFREPASHPGPKAQGGYYMA